jgi:hypothetical protein
MRLSYLLIIADLALSGCASEHGLGFMVGTNISHAVDRLGYPDAKREVRGETIYVWSSSHDVNLPRKTNSTTAGNLGHVPIYTTPAGMIYRRNCTIQLTADKDGKVEYWLWTGDKARCGQFASRLR